MLRDLVPLLLALGAAAAIYILREIRRKRLRMNPPKPGLTMREAWELWQRGSVRSPDSRFMPDVLHSEAPPAAIARLLEIERWCSEADNPRLAARDAVLQNVIIALHLEELLRLGEAEKKTLLRGYEEGMDEALREAWKASAVQWSVLRLYAMLKYDDAVAGDWFHHFVQVARPYIREKARLARAFVLERDEGSGRFVEIYDALLGDLRKQMLKARPKKRFVTPDLA